MSDPVGYWMGRPISEMDREELLKVVNHLLKAHHMQREQHMADLDALVPEREARRPG